MKWMVLGTAQVGVYVIVDADTEDEAVRRADAPGEWIIDLGGGDGPDTSQVAICGALPEGVFEEPTDKAP